MTAIMPPETFLEELYKTSGRCDSEDAGYEESIDTQNSVFLIMKYFDQHCSNGRFGFAHEALKLVDLNKLNPSEVYPFAVYSWHMMNDKNSPNKENNLAFYRRLKNEEYPAKDRFLEIMSHGGTSPDFRKQFLEA